MLSLHKMCDTWLITTFVTQSKNDPARVAAILSYSDMIGLFGGRVGCLFILITNRQ